MADLESSPAQPRLRYEVYLIALVYLLLHVATATRYGYFRDGMYYLACAEHLSWGFVDHPPLIVFLAWIVRHTLGTSLHAFLLLPALAGAARILLTAAFARALGARRFGIALAATLAALPGVWMVIDHQFAMNTLEPLFWTGCAFVVLRMIQTGNPRLWLLFGAISGLGMENKYAIAVFCFALLVGLLLTEQRKLLFTPWLFAGGAVALLIWAPNLLWNIQHHWPFLELMHNVRATGKDVVLGPVAFVAQQVLMMGPQTLPVWFTGLLFYFFSRRLRDYRCFGWTFVVTIAFFCFAHGKDYYSAPAYPLVLAAGAIAVEMLFSSPRFLERPALLAILKPALYVWLLALVVLLLPIVLPVLSIEAFARFQKRLPFELAKSETEFASQSLPQYYADEFGWEEMVAAVARVYNSLPPEDRPKTAILTGNYGQAAAIDLFGPKYGLPKSICAHQSYYLWGPRNYTGEIVIRVGGKYENARQVYESVTIAAISQSPYQFEYENRPILLCRGLKGNLQTRWPELKTWR